MSENINNPQAEEVKDVNSLRQIRVEKLEALQSAGKDPFEISSIFPNDSFYTEQSTYIRLCLI